MAKLAEKEQAYRILFSFGQTEYVTGKVREFKEIPNELIGFHKKGNVVVATHIRSGLEICKQKTFAKCNAQVIDLLSKSDVVEMIKNATDIDKAVDFFNKKIAKKVTLRDEFYNLTGINLPFDFFGLNIIKLDEMINPPDGTSLNDYLIQKYGKRASEIVDELIKQIGEH